MIGIIDYGAGNLFSVKNALDYLEVPYVVTSDAEQLEHADQLILPGVGAFPYAMKQLEKTGLTDFLSQIVGKKPLLGICLGMQMLFEESEEFGLTKGLGLIPGRVKKFPPSDLKIPHMGWNQLRIHQPQNPLLSGIQENDCVYFVHSYLADTTSEYVAADCQYGVSVPALVSNGMVFGAQFHPEKSGAVGLQILKNFGGLGK